MKTILVTGRMGVGKTELLSLLEKKGYLVFSSDEKAKELLHPQSVCYKQIKKLFPESELYQEGGFFDKKKLAQLIFKNPEKRQALEQIIHPRVRDLFEEFVQEGSQKQADFLFYEAPLISKKILKSCDLSLLITSSYDKQKRRLLKLGWKEEEIKWRLNSQLSEKDLIKEVGFIIENNSNKEDLEQKLNVFLNKLKATREAEQKIPKKS